MKAKRIQKIKRDMKYYHVWVTKWYDMFGVVTDGEPDAVLLARNPQEASRRASRKGLRPQDEYQGLQCDSRFGKYAVRPADKVSERFTTYWR